MHEQAKKTRYVSFVRINGSISARQNANSWLVKRFEIIFHGSLCHIPCRDIVAHLFRRSQLRLELPNLSHNMARAHEKPLLKRHHLVPHNQARVPEIDEVKGASGQMVFVLLSFQIGPMPRKLS